MEKYSTKDFEKQFPNDDKCLEYLFNKRYPQGVNCEKCGQITKHYHVTNQPYYVCEYCKGVRHPMQGTIFEDT